MKKTTSIKSGIWTTNNGSILQLSIDENGLASGSYSTSHGRPDIEESFPITGWVHNDLIGLVCAWGKHHSLTSWCGRYTDEEGQDTIHYMWHLASEYEDAEQTIKKELILTFQTMSGIFYRQQD